MPARPRANWGWRSIWKALPCPAKRGWKFAEQPRSIKGPRRRSDRDTPSPADLVADEFVFLPCAFYASPFEGHSGSGRNKEINDVQVECTSGVGSGAAAGELFP